MGFFDRFRKRVQEVADETDLDELTAEEGTEEAVEALRTTDSEPPQEVFETTRPSISVHRLQRC